MSSTFLFVICLVCFSRELWRYFSHFLRGLIASVGRDGDERDILLIESLARSFTVKSSCVILLTVACESTSSLFVVAALL
jgi:hypothetical protein